MKICKNETFESINKKLYKLKKKWYSDSIQKEWKIIKKNIPLKYIKSYLEYYKKDNILKLYNEIKFYHLLWNNLVPDNSKVCKLSWLTCL